MTDQPFKTTVVGSMPKPDWLMENLPLNTKGKQVHGKGANWQFEGEILEAALDDATRLTVHDQIIAGIDIISDGEQRRTSYLTYITSKLSGFDYDNLAEKWTRNNRRLAEVGQCVGPIKRVNNLLSKDLEFLKSQTALPVKVTLPGPMTVVDSTFDNYYDDEVKMAMDVAVALNEEALALEKLGVSVIQFDEPVFSRYPDKVVDWGIQALDRCLLGLSKSKTAAHICYSYPMPGVPRPIVDSYPVILKALEDSKIDELALEFEASKLDPKLLAWGPAKPKLFVG